jgi:hypothetical protein
MVLTMLDMTLAPVFVALAGTASDRILASLE